MPHPVSELLRSESPVRWLFYGDSITHGALHTFGGRGFPEIFREHVVYEMGRRQDLVLNSAYSGFTAAELLLDFDFRAAAFRPHAAFVMIGTNDCTRFTVEEFRANLETLRLRFQEIDCTLVLQTTIPPVVQLNPQRATVGDFAEALRAFAAEHAIDCIDHWKLWSALPLQERFYLLSDPLHPNGDGHLKIAHDIFRAIGCFTPDTPVCRMQPGPRITT